MEGRLFLGNGFNPVNHIFLGVGKIVHNHRFMSGVQQLHHGVTADLTCATSYQYIHFKPPDLSHQ